MLNNVHFLHWQQDALQNPDVVPTLLLLWRWMEEV